MTFLLLLLLLPLPIASLCFRHLCLPLFQGLSLGSFEVFDEQSVQIREQIGRGIFLSFEIDVDGIADLTICISTWRFRQSSVNLELGIASLTHWRGRD